MAVTDPNLTPEEDAAVREPAPASGAPREGCGRAGCGFVLGVVGSAVITLAVLAVVLTGGHPLTVVSRILPARSTASPTPTAELPTLAPTKAAVSTAGRTPTPTFIPIPTAIPTATPSPSPTLTATPTATPTPRIALRQVNQLGRYESMQFLIQTVVDLSREPSNFWERICGSDQLLLVAGGEAIAGFDLAKIGPDDLQVDGRILRLALPPPEVFSYFIKEDQTYVYQRNTGVFCRPDANLETEARREAEQRLLHYALEQDILGRAEQNGVSQLEAFFRNLGFEQVELTVKAGD